MNKLKGLFFKDSNYSSIHRLSVGEIAKLMQPSYKKLNPPKEFARTMRVILESCSNENCSNYRHVTIDKKSSISKKGFQR